jgi:hypothetical protein
MDTGTRAMRTRRRIKRGGLDVWISNSGAEANAFFFFAHPFAKKQVSTPSSSKAPTKYVSIRKRK